MTGVDVIQNSLFVIEARQEDSNDRGEVDVVNIEAVDAFHEFGERISFGSHRAHNSLKAGHQHTGRDAVPADIGNDQALRAIAELEEVEIIAADDIGWAAERG